MIFTPKLVGKVLKGEKVRHSFYASREACPYSTGRSYAVQSRPGSIQACRVKVTHIARGKLHELTDEQARLEGFDSAMEFWDWFLERHNIGWGHREWKGGKKKVLVEVPMWHVDFEVDPLVPLRWLHKDSSHGYTASGPPSQQAVRFKGSRTQALMDEEPAVPIEVQDRYSKQGRANDSLRQAEKLQNEADALREQIDVLKAWALKNGLDARSELRVLERRLQEKLRRRAA